MKDVRCFECGGIPRKIGNEIYYCDDCDKIITEKRQEEQLILN